MSRSLATGNAEPLLTSSGIARRIQELTGHKPGRSTLWRWHLTGRLKSRRIGARLYAADSAIREMLAADEERNPSSAGARGKAAAARVEAIVKSSRRTKGGRK